MWTILWLDLRHSTCWDKRGDILRGIKKEYSKTIIKEPVTIFWRKGSQIYMNGINYDFYKDNKEINFFFCYFSIGNDDNHPFVFNY